MLFFLSLNRVSTIILANLGRVSSVRLLVKQLPRPRRLAAWEQTEILPFLLTELGSQRKETFIITSSHNPRKDESNWMKIL